MLRSDRLGLRPSPAMKSSIYLWSILVPSCEVPERNFKHYLKQFQEAKPWLSVASGIDRLLRAGGLNGLTGGRSGLWDEHVEHAVR